MNTALLHTDIQTFINAHLNTNITRLLLKGVPFSNIDAKLVIEQIEAKKRSEKKLPTWFTTPNIYYPNKLNIEQTSSEITAQYKSELISGTSLIDLTGGLGVDCYYFAKCFKQVTHCDINARLSQITAHNFQQLGIDNISCIQGDGLQYLKSNTKAYNWIYIDPSRRHDNKGKVFFLNDCLPNVPKHLDLLFKHAQNILIKTSPLLDISVGINELQHVKTIHCIAVNNEVKELLWVLETGYSGTLNINTVNIKANKKETFNLTLDDEQTTKAQYHAPCSYLYEPNAAILKSGAFNVISKQLQVFKLHKHTHLYTSDTSIDFPGRAFKIENILPYNKKTLKQSGIKKANITTRNFPETVAQIRKKFGIKDGGDCYLFFTTDVNNSKVIIICAKIN